MEEKEELLEYIDLVLRTKNNYVCILQIHYFEAG
jgi:hypothetical protein